MLKGDFAELQKMADGLGSVGRTIDASLSRAAARIQSMSRAGYAAGKGPSGEKWEPKKDGSPAMQGPAAEVTFKASGKSIVGNAPDVFDYHKETRPVFPQGEAPSAWTQVVEEEIQAGIEKAFT